MKIFGVEIKTRNKREEKLVSFIRFSIIQTTTNPRYVRRDVSEIAGQITALFFMDMIDVKEYETLNDRRIEWEFGVLIKAANASQSFRKGGAAA